MKSKTSTAPKVLKSYTASRPNYVGLAEGQSITGVFIGVSEGQFGPAYKFRVEDGIIHLSGNRHQLDSIMDEVVQDAEGFQDGTAFGHTFTVRRAKNIKTEAGRTVGVYTVEHIMPCAKGCNLLPD